MGNCGKIPYKEIGNWTQRTGPLAQPRGVGVSSVDNRDRDLEKGLGMCVCVWGGEGWEVLTPPTPPFLHLLLTSAQLRFAQSYIRGCASSASSPLPTTLHPQTLPSRSKDVGWL